MDNLDKKLLQPIHRSFFAMRNGAVADVLRQGGLKCRTIFGLNLPQITGIASGLERSAGLAELLWSDDGVRESRLLAPMVYPVDEFDFDTAQRWCATLDNAEAADVLCLKLLKRCHFARDLAFKLLHSESDILRYTALRLMMHMLPLHVAEARSSAQAELGRQCPLTFMVASALIDEIDFITQQ